MFDEVYFEFPKVASFFFIFLACESLCKMRLPALYFPHTAKFVQQTISQSKLLLLLKWLGISMLTVALMSPVRDVSVALEPVQGYEIALVLDASQSMRAQGFNLKQPNMSRFDVLQSIVARFIQARPNDTLGVVVFGSHAFVASPLTYDRRMLEGILAQLHITMAGKFTALYEATAQAVNLLSRTKGKNKIAIILTDGHNTPGGKIPLDVVLSLAKKEGVKLYTIGIGSSQEYNAEILRKMALSSGAKSYDAQNADALQKIYDQIDALEKFELGHEQYHYKIYYYLYPLFIGFFSLLFFVYLRNKRGWA